MTSKAREQSGKSASESLVSLIAETSISNLTFFLFLCFFFAFKRIINDRLSVSQEPNASDLASQRYQGQHLQRSCMENLKDGLADWFVIKHTKDQSLSRHLLSKNGFVAADATAVGITKS